MEIYKDLGGSEYFSVSSQILKNELYLFYTDFHRTKEYSPNCFYKDVTKPENFNRKEL